MSQKPSQRYIEYSNLVCFLNHLCNHSNIYNRQINRADSTAIFEGKLKIGDGEYDSVSINIWFQRRTFPTRRNIEPDLSQYFLTRFDIHIHPNCTLKRRILSGGNFIRKIGCRLATSEERGGYVSSSIVDELFTIRTEGSLWALFENYIRWARFYECIPIFSLGV